MHKEIQLPEDDTATHSYRPNNIRINYYCQNAKSSLLQCRYRTNYLAVVSQ